MKMSKYLYIIICGLAAILYACKGTSDVAVPTADAVELSTDRVIAMPKSGSQYMPMAVVYRTNGAFNNNVMVVCDPSGIIVSYPDPLDITANSMPVDLGDGWLLDRRGAVGARSAFLTYTYDEYAALDKVPTVAELTASIIPGASITEYMVLPITAAEAMADPEAAKKYILKK